MDKVIGIDALTVKTWLESNEAILVDVREIEEYQEAYIEGAILIPLGDFTADAVPQNPNKKIIFQCRSGKRSERAAIVAHDIERMQPTYNFEGGILAWVESGYQTKTV